MDAMILAAGRGERMRPLTDTLPKPLVPVHGAPLIEHHIRKLVAIGVDRVIINTSYLADLLQAALGDGNRFGCQLIYSYEPEPLESGGGIATASQYFESAALPVLSADVYSDFDYTRLLQPLKAIENEQDDAHFVMVLPTPGEPGGEFALEAGGRVGLGQPRLTLANIVVLRTELCRRWPRYVRFKLLPDYQQWVGAGRVSGEQFDGLWCNVTRVADVQRLNEIAL